MSTMKALETKPVSQSHECSRVQTTPAHTQPCRGLWIGRKRCHTPLTQVPNLTSQGHRTCLGELSFSHSYGLAKVEEAKFSLHLISFILYLISLFQRKLALTIHAISFKGVFTPSRLV